MIAASEAGAINAYAMPPQVEMPTVWDAIRPQLQEVMAGRIEPAKAAAIMQVDAREKIRARK